MRPMCLVAILLVTAACERNGAPRARVGDVADPKVEVAAEAVVKFHQAIDNERFADICEISSKEAFGPVSCGEFLGGLRRKLGKVKTSAPVQLPSVEVRTPGQPVRVGLRYDTEFEKGAGVEEFEWQITAAYAKLTGYKVNTESNQR